MYDLAIQNSRLEPKRQNRSQVRLAKLVRELSQSIFGALENAAKCHCAHPHNVCLELAKREANLLPNDEENEVAKRFDFHIALGSYKNPVTKTNPEENAPPLEQSTRWDSLLIKFDSDSDAKPGPYSSIIATEDPYQHCLPRKVRFNGQDSCSKADRTHIEPFSTESLPKSLATTKGPHAKANPSILNWGLCQRVLTWNKDIQKPTIERYSCYIADSRRRFRVGPNPDYPEHKSAVTLRQILERRDPEVRGINYPEKLRIASAISIHTLYLFDTHWLARALTLDDIKFLRKAQTVSEHTSSILGPFIYKNLVISPPTAFSVLRKPSIQNHESDSAVT